MVEVTVDPTENPDVSTTLNTFHSTRIL